MGERTRKSNGLRNLRDFKLKSIYENINAACLCRKIKLKTFAAATAVLMKRYGLERDGVFVSFSYIHTESSTVATNTLQQAVLVVGGAMDHREERRICAVVAEVAQRKYRCYVRTGGRQIDGWMNGCYMKCTCLIYR